MVDISTSLAARGIMAAAGLRNTATRAANPLAKYSLSSANAQTGQLYRGEPITSIQVEDANWYSDSSVHEAGTGNTATISRSIYHPVLQQWFPFTYGGATTKTMADGGTTGLSDALIFSTPIPDGSRLLMRAHIETSANSMAVNLLANSGGTQIGDLFEGNATAGFYADKTLNGATINPNNGASPNVRPLRVVTNSARRSLLILGNSRDQGQGSTPPDTGDVGDIAPSFGPYMGYQNMSVVGETLQGLISTGTRRMAAAVYATDCVLLDAINDITNGRTAVQIIADYITIVGMLKAVNPALNVWVKTTSPKVTTADGITQTVDTNNAIRISVNAMIRGGLVTSSAGIVDTASVDEDYANPGKYETPNGKAIVGTDGLHKIQYGYEYQRRGGAADPRKLILRF